MTTGLSDGRQGRDVAFMPTAQHNGGETIEPAGSSTEATIPDGTTLVFISAEGGAVYYEVNGTDADADSPGYVPEDNQRVIFSCSNLSTLFVYAAASVKAHIEYYKE